MTLGSTEAGYQNAPGSPEPESGGDPTPGISRMAASSVSVSWRVGVSNPQSVPFPQAVGVN